MRTYVDAFAGQARLAQGTQDRGKRRVGHATVFTPTAHARRQRPTPTRAKPPPSRKAAPHVRGVRLPACAVDGAVHVFEAAETSVRGDQVHE